MPAVRRHVRELESSHSYGLVLVLIILSIVFSVGSPNEKWASFVEVVLSAATLLVACWTARSRDWVLHLAIALVVGATIAAAALLATPSGGTGGIKLANALIIAMTPLVLGTGLAASLAEHGVDRHAVAGALAIYLLIGSVCAVVYGAVADLGSGPLFSSGQGDGTSAEHVYFSFITQTTVGYGDFTPASDAARAVAVLEALVGQLYLVTVVGLVVGNFRGRRTA